MSVDGMDGRWNQLLEEFLVERENWQRDCPIVHSYAPLSFLVLNLGFFYITNYRKCKMF